LGMARDWSSDVCSSDLAIAAFALMVILIGILVFFPGNRAGQGTVPGANQSAPQPVVPFMKIDYGTLPPLGNTTAPVAMIEFEDYQCEYCSGFYGGAEREIRRDYVDAGKVRLYYRDLPLSFHDKSMDAAMAARCANAQGKFWDMHDTLFDRRNEWAPVVESMAGGRFLSYANDTGLDLAAFAACYGNKTYAPDIQKDISEETALGITSTPKFALIIPKSRAPGFEVSFDSVRSALPSQFFDIMRLAQDNDNYIVIIEGEQQYSLFKALLNGVQY
jgi:protein-disulfide isomerase